jgi:uncharacterized RDD family membrane protein YckC
MSDPTITQTSNLPSSIARRFGAEILDSLVIIIPALAVNHVIPVAGGLLVWFLYSPVFEASELRATVGKYWMGVQVTDLQGARITFRAAVLRNVLKFLSSTLIFLGHIVAFFTARKQAVHDLVADTVVVYGRSEAPIFESWADSLKEIFGKSKNV